jgi:hypothetical protein
MPWAAYAQDAPGLVTAPAYSNLTPYLGIPPYLEDRLIYYNSFDSPDGKPEIVTIAAKSTEGPRRGVSAPTRGVIGRCTDTAVRLRSSAFSPHRPLTISFWWALQEDAKVDGAFGLFHLANGRGFISHFSRGKGQWCALDRPAGVLQVYYLHGIQNVNGIYDRDWMAHIALKAGVWHHTALTFSAGSVVILYTDGIPVYAVHLRGRDFAETDALHDLSIGNRGGAPLWVDEVIILQRVLTPDEIAEYVRIVTSMRQAYP